VGFVVASIGPAVITGTFRYTFGSVGLYSGVSLVALALGAFAIPQMMTIFGSGTAVAREDLTGKAVDASEAVVLGRGVMKPVLGVALETFKHSLVVIQGGLTGAFAGIVPGVGGFAANFMSYAIARQVSRKDRHLFGTGIPQGIIGPEGASLAKE